MSGLHISALSHAYNAEDVVKGVSVFVAPGELVCLLGPSGCGKTTLLRVAAGLEALQKGEVHIGEELVASGPGAFNLPPEKRGIGLMFQDYALFPHLTVSQNILFGVNAKERDSSWLESSLAQMGLTDYAASYPHTLSGGQQQRVALLRAIAPKPRVLFLDEPFSGLDVTRRAETREQTLAFLKKSGVATLMVTHDPEEAMFMADRILVMDHGRMVQDGSPEDIYFRPNSSFVTRLFGGVNSLEGKVQAGKVETPLGIFDANNIADGDRAEILIRPDGIMVTELQNQTSTGESDSRQLNADGHAKGFRVLEARSLGRSSRIVFEVTQEGGAAKTIEARVPGTLIPSVGSQISVSVNSSDAHVFAITHSTT